MTKEELQLLLSAMALLLTPFLSALVVRHQLKRSHHWWVKQQEFLENQRYAERRNDIYERAARVLPRLQTLLLDQQIFLFSKNECEYLLKYCKKPELVNREFVGKEYERYIKLTVEQNSAIRELTAEMQQIAFTARKFYDENTLRHFQNLFQKVKLASNQVLSLKEVVTFLNQKIEEGVDIDTARAQLGTEFDTKWEQIKPGDVIAAILDSMFVENFPNKRLPNNGMHPTADTQALK